MSLSHAAARTALVLGVCLSVALCTGCDGGRRVTGKVIAGPASIPVVVPSDDPRLTDAAGLAGVDVTISSRGQVAHRLTSEQDGTFSFNASGPVRTGQVEVEASSGTIVPVRGTLYLPLEGQRLLIIARPRSTGG